MTNGLLISRRKKLSLYTEYIVDRTSEKFNTYKIFINLYNTVLRLNKKSFYESKLKETQKDPLNLLGNF